MGEPGVPSDDDRKEATRIAESILDDIRNDDRAVLVQPWMWLLASTVVWYRDARERPAKSTVARVERGDYVRVSGDVLCATCNHLLYDHAPVRGFEFLRHACDGRLVKL